MHERKREMDSVKPVSGNNVIKVLKKIGFSFVKQRGNHVKLKRTTPEGTKIVIVPLHKDLPSGLLHSISRQAGFPFKDFEELLEVFV